MLKIAWCSDYILPVPANHRFPMSKYELLPLQLLHEGTIQEDNLFAPSALPEEWVLTTHREEYWNRLKNMSLTPQEVRRTGFQMSKQLIVREQLIASGTLQCVHHARDHGISMNIAGGTHHAFTDRGEGFCLLNDMAIAANYLLHQNLASRILVVDLDVHQGNGTAEIFRSNERVFTFSMHGANNYPIHKEQSDLDIGLQDHTSDRFYLSTLDANLKSIVNEVEPDFIFYQCGVDILDTDQLGKLSVSREGCRERDRIVLDLAHRNRIPIVATMGGGYSKDLRDIVDAHANTFRLAQSIYF